MIPSHIMNELRFRIGSVVLLCLMSLSSLSQVACSNFGPNGVTLPGISNNTYLSAMAVQPDGKIVAVGYYEDKDGKDFLVARFLPDGKPDPSFGRYGVSEFDVTGQNKEDKAYCLALTTDGRILVGGESNGYGAIIRVNNNGNLDTGFSGDGKLIYGYLYSTVDAIKLTGTDFLAISRTLYLNNVVFRKLSVYAFTAAGNPLTTYGENGIYENLDFVVDRKHSFSAALQADNKLLVGASTFLTNDSDNVTLVRLNANGTTDNTFGTSGMFKASATADAWVHDVSVSGTSVYTGFTRGINTATNQFAEVIKLNVNGALSSDFNNTGRSVHDGAGVGARLKGMVVNTAGAVTIAGSKKNGSNLQYLLASYAANGDPDGAFNAKTFSIAGYSSGELNDIVALSDGSFLACGYAASASDTLGAIFKFTSAGELQTTFNGTGYQFAYHATSSYSDVVGIQADGKIVVAGAIASGNEWANTLVRLHPNGLPDMSFGKRGIIINDNSVIDNYEIAALHSLPGGGVFTCGTGDGFVVTKFLANGTPDNSFGTSGIVQHKVDFRGGDTHDMTLDAQGNVLIAGGVDIVNQTYTESIVLRFLPDGTPDPAFGTAGAVKISFSTRDDKFYSVAVSPDNKIYAAGYAVVNLKWSATVVRLMNDGSVDTSFGTNGTIILPVTSVQQNRAHKILVQPDGKVIVAYHEMPTTNPLDDRIFICRYLTDGTPDTSYGTNGTFHITFPDGTFYGVRGLVRDNTGRLYVSGNYVKGAKNHFFLARLLPNGGLDTSYGTTGYYETKVYRVPATTSINTLALNPTTGSLYSAVYLVDEDNMHAVACIGPAGSTPDCSTIPKPVITRDGGELVSTAADSYRWFLNGSDLNLQTQSITPVNEGNYTVEVTWGECTKTSDPFTYSVTGIGGHEQFAWVYPNPVENNLVVKTLRPSGVLSVYSSQGLLLMQSPLVAEQQTISMESLPEGLYLLVLQNGNESQSFRIVKGSH